MTFHSVILSSCRVMRFQSLKNTYVGQNLHASMEGFCRDSHIVVYIVRMYAFSYI